MLTLPAMVNLRLELRNFPNSDLDRGCYLADDIILSNALSASLMPIYVNLDPNVTKSYQYDYGFDKDALHKGADGFDQNPGASDTPGKSHNQVNSELCWHSMVARNMWYLDYFYVDHQI